MDGAVPPLDPHSEITQSDFFGVSIYVITWKGTGQSSWPITQHMENRHYIKCKPICDQAKTPCFGYKAYSMCTDLMLLNPVQISARALHVCSNQPSMLGH